MPAWDSETYFSKINAKGPVRRVAVEICLSVYQLFAQL